MRTIGHRHQRTISAPVGVSGVGFVTGARVALRFRPAPPNTGLVFVRTDLPGAPAVAARADNVLGTRRRTTLGQPETGVTLVEHVLAALAGLRIDNCYIDLDGPEPPGLDGSAAGFVAALRAVGVVAQDERRPVLAATEPITVRGAGATLTLHPPEGDAGLRASYRLDYGYGAPLAPELHTAELNPETFGRDIARCRTFLTEPEARELRAQGVGRHLTPADVLVFGPRGPIDNRLRYADEPARHKILDLVGDLALCGFDLAGHLVAYRSGHTQNVELARTLILECRKSSGPKVVPARRAA